MFGRVQAGFPLAGYPPTTPRITPARPSFRSQPFDFSLGLSPPRVPTFSSTNFRFFYDYAKGFLMTFSWLFHGHIFYDLKFYDHQNVPAGVFRLKIATRTAIYFLRWDKSKLEQQTPTGSSRTALLRITTPRLVHTRSHTVQPSAVRAGYAGQFRQVLC